MSFVTGNVRQVAECSKTAARNARRAASAVAAKGNASQPTIYAGTLLSRPPLTTRQLTEFESAYYQHTRSVRSALANPVPTQFYFKPGSLPQRRFQLTNYASELETFGPKLAGKAPVLGDVPLEAEVDAAPRDKWAKEDAERGEKSLERFPEEEVYCLVKRDGKWTLPRVPIEFHRGEGFDETVRRGILGKEGSLGGLSMDAWLVSRKPIGFTKDGEERTFILKSHILAGEPTYEKETGMTDHAWLRAEEVESKLKEQGDEKVWDQVKGMFGVSA